MRALPMPVVKVCKAFSRKIQMKTACYLESL